MESRDSSDILCVSVSLCVSLLDTQLPVMMSGRRVGFCLSDKKRRRMNLDAFADFCAGRGVEVVEIDLTQPLVPQGPFDVIVHKLSDVIVEAEHDSQSQQLLANFQSYVSAHPSTVLLDPLPAMTQLLDRFASYRIMSELHNSLRDWRVCSPPFLEIHSVSDLSSIQQALMSQCLSFPLICKTRVAHGSLSHEMSLIFSAGSLADIHPPCVLQSFVSHGAVLHKVFVVGDRHFCVERPSLKNFPSGPCVCCPFLFLPFLSCLVLSCHVLSCRVLLCPVMLPCFSVLCFQTGRPSSSTAIMCPSRSQTLISQHWTSKCRACLLPAPRPWPPWSESSEFSSAWPCLAWMSSSTCTRTPSPSSTSTSSQAMREFPSFSPPCSATSSQCWTNGPPQQELHLLQQPTFNSPQEHIADCTVFHQLPRTNEVVGIHCFVGTKLSCFQDFGTLNHTNHFVPLSGSDHLSVTIECCRNES
ncbi:uncharacterized protein LOC119491869 isoform X1 [Sebastes umbrosus]|uniref:uncharacterized protein LOC119491869 isoform X1 n=1 Tax=Sebastes umbrosus TaxID=72105 RepID=UPI00189D3CBA|nr:uncharacterized protein LOC119491869 isoform X1 [Sebastes umbrosus]